MSDEKQPPPGLPRPRQALWWLREGGLAMGAGWEKAHELCQMAEGEPANDLVHALVHWIEGDLPNRDYWYRRAGQRPASDIAGEWARIDAQLSKE